MVGQQCSWATKVVGNSSSGRCSSSFTLCKDNSSRLGGNPISRRAWKHGIFARLKQNWKLPAPRQSDPLQAYFSWHLYFAAPIQALQSCLWTEQLGLLWGLHHAYPRSIWKAPPLQLRSNTWFERRQLRLLTQVVSWCGGERNLRMATFSALTSRSMEATSLSTRAFHQVITILASFNDQILFLIPFQLSHYSTSKSEFSRRSSLWKLASMRLPSWASFSWSTLIFVSVASLILLGRRDGGWKYMGKVTNCSIASCLTIDKTGFERKCNSTPKK